MYSEETSTAKELALVCNSTALTLTHIKENFGIICNLELMSSYARRYKMSWALIVGNHLPNHACLYNIILKVDL